MNLACYQFYASSPASDPSLPPYVLACTVGIVIALGLVLFGLVLFLRGSEPIAA